MCGPTVATLQRDPETPEELLSGLKSSIKSSIFHRPVTSFVVILTDAAVMENLNGSKWSCRFMVSCSH